MGGHHICVLQVVFRDDGVSVHAVLFHRQVVGAATSALVGAGHDSEPAPLPLHKVCDGFSVPQKTSTFVLVCVLSLKTHPWFPPGVADNPEFNSVLHSPSRHRHDVVDKRTFLVF